MTFVQVCSDSVRYYMLLKYIHTYIQLLLHLLFSSFFLLLSEEYDLTINYSLIQVKYAPKINLSVVSGATNNKIPEGSEARVRCLVDANPPAQMYAWYLNNYPVVGDYTDEMVRF